ncbi:MAG TPA: low temperature requirement protein A, partial [Ktedonobacteraceae bacterium]
GLYVWGRRDPAARWFCTRFAIGLAFGAVLWLVSLWIPAPARYSLWALALLVEMGTPFIVSLNLTGRIYYVSHIPERLGVFTLIVLGEAIVQVGAGLVGTHWQIFSVLTAIGSFVIAACLWWIYFDRIDSAVIDRALTRGKQEMVRSFSWSYIHLVLYAGLTAASVGIARAIAVSPGRLDNGARIALCVGIAVALFAISLIQQLSPHHLPRSELIIRLAASIAALLLALFGMGLSSLAIVGLLMLLLVTVTVFEVARFEHY